jgi:1,4-dihydroxy-2-naphthoate polyprenyltransferase
MLSAVIRPGINDYLGTLRVPFLLLNLSCVALGAGCAFWRRGSIDWTDALLALVGAVCAHASVNSLNEYSDFHTGVDSRTVRTPFSGGSGTLQRHPEMVGYALGIGLTCAAVTAAIGIYFVVACGWRILLVGILGLVTVSLYTPWLTRRPFLCLVAPGLGFGTCMVMGTDAVLGGDYSMAAFAASMVPFFLVSNLLLLNQFPDVEADRTGGRKNVLIVHGIRAGAAIYTLFQAGAYISVIVAVVVRILPPLSLLALLTFPLAVRTSIGAIRDGTDRDKLKPALGINVLINLLTPLLLASGLFLSR